MSTQARVVFAKLASDWRKLDGLFAMLDYSNIVSSAARYLRFGIAIAVIVGALSYLAFTGIQECKSYYVTIKELQGMNDKSHARRLRVAGQVVPGSIQRQRTGADFQLDEQGLKLRVAYRGIEPPPDTFKDNAQALVEGSYGSDEVFHRFRLSALRNIRQPRIKAIRPPLQAELWRQVRDPTDL